MTWPDYAILATIAISILVGMLRGFVKEVFSLLIWGAAFALAYQFGGDVASIMEDQVTLPSARTAMGFAGVFILVLLVGGLLGYLIGRLVDSTGLTGTDRLLGGAFGIARGLALVVACVLVAGFTPIPADPWWRESAGIKRLMPLVEWAADYLPDKMHDHLDFDPLPREEGPADEDEPAHSKSPKSKRAAPGKEESNEGDIDAGEAPPDRPPSDEESPA